MTDPRAAVSGGVDNSENLQYVSVSSRNPQPLYTPTTNLLEVLDDCDEDEMAATISDEDAQSLVEPSMSRMASRLKSPRTPALEKAAAMEELEGGGYFDSGDETPTPQESDEQRLYEEFPTSQFSSVWASANKVRQEEVPKPSSQGQNLSLGKLPSPKIEESTMPVTPWHVEPKAWAVQRPERPSQSALHGVFDTVRSRSLSGGAEALKKFLPKGLPSMAQVGNLFSSASTSHKEKSSSQTPSGTSSPAGGSPPRGSSPRTLSFVPIGAPGSGPLTRQGTGTGQRPQVLRRSTSDHSLLYHSLSRASSLGDDTRFENHREQVNSRMKAIRDSLQDRSSFRMPQMPSMPTIPRVSSFSFSTNFLNSANVPARWKSYTDPVPDILPAVVTKKKPSTIAANTSVNPGMVGMAVSRPEAASQAARNIKEDSTLSFFDRALESLVGDIVIMGGYRGSVLRSTQTNRQVWVPVKVGLNIRKVDLEVGLEPEDEERMEETIYASGMLQNIGPVDISKRLFKRLSECENARNGKLRVWDYGYDWRLSPRLLSRKLTQFLEKLPSNIPSQDGSTTGAIVIAHSLGGLITRHVINHTPELVSGVIYAGVPHACVNILGPLRNGDAVLLSQRVLTAQVNFTLRTSFLLLPEDGRCFFDLRTKEQYPVDFFNLDDWIKYRFSPCTDPPLPPKNQPTGGLGSLLTMPTSLLSLPISGKKSPSGSSSPMPSSYNEGSNKIAGSAPTHSSPTLGSRAADAVRAVEGGTDRTLAPQMGNNTNPVSKGHSTNSSVSTAVTIPREKAITYLKRTLAETKKFKQELHFRPSIAEENRYPPTALIYGKSIPTVYGAKVDGRDGIPCSDVYDNLAFASGDGVCLAKEAMLPEGYRTVYGGRITSERGHVTLLGDLNAVGRALEAIRKGRQKGIGLGVQKKTHA